MSTAGTTNLFEITDLADPRLADYSHLTDVALKKSGGGLYIAESLLVLQRALAAGHRPRSVLALGSSVEDAVRATAGFDIPIFAGEPELLEELTGYLLHRGLIAAMHRPELLRSWASDVVGMFDADYIWHDIAAVLRCSHVSGSRSGRFLADAYVNYGGRLFGTVLGCAVRRPPGAICS